MIKPIFDITLSTIGLPMLAPVFVLITFQIRRKFCSPVILREVCASKDGIPLEIVKLSAICRAMDDMGVRLSDSERMIPSGAILRATSQDELSELWNVLKGDMSLVGPRPLLMK